MSTTRCSPVIGLAYGLRRARPGARRRPSPAAARVLLGQQMRAERPGVDEHQVEVGDAAPRQHLDDPRVLAQRHVGLVVLVDRDVGLRARPRLERGHAVVVDRDDGAVGHVLRAVPEMHDALARRPRARLPQRGLVGLVEVDERDPPPVPDAVLPPQRPGHQADLVGRQRIERMSGHGWIESVSRVDKDLRRLPHSDHRTSDYLIRSAAGHALGRPAEGRVHRGGPPVDPDAIGRPGEFPYTRGVYPSMYRGRLWTMRQFAGFGTAEETNERFRYLLDHGQTGLSTAFDMPSLMGHDSDHPRSLGEVGREGVAIDTLDDMETPLPGHRPRRGQRSR